MFLSFYNLIITPITNMGSTLSNAVSQLYSIPGVLPSLWNVLPSSLTSVFFALIVVTTFLCVLKAVLR